VQPTTQPSWLLRLRIVEFTLDHEAPYLSNSIQRIPASVALNHAFTLCSVLQPITQPSRLLLLWSSAHRCFCCAD
jgi:hypothetical protein